MARIHIPKGTAHAVTLRQGQTLRIINVEGKQVADFIAFNADDLTEFTSPIHTLVSIGSLFPKLGDTLRSNRRRPIVEIVKDDTGKHDMLIAACDPWRYEYDFNVKGHRSCADNYLEVLAPWRIERHQLPHVFDFFQNMSYPDGKVTFGESLAKPGDTLELRALMNLVAAVSACPMDLNPISGYKTHDLALEVL